MSNSKALPPELTAKLREEIRAWVATEHGGNATAAARALGLSQPAVRDVILGNRGVGAKLLEAFATVTGRGIDELLGRAVGGRDDEPAWVNLPGYRESERALRTEAPHRYSEAVYMKGRRLRGVRPLELPVTVVALRRLLTWIEENTSLDELATLEEERIDKQRVKDNKAAETRARNKAAKLAAAEAKAPKLPAGKK